MRNLVSQGISPSIVADCAERRRIDVVWQRLEKTSFPYSNSGRMSRSLQRVEGSNILLLSTRFGCLDNTNSLRHTGAGWYPERPMAPSIRTFWMPACAGMTDGGRASILAFWHQRAVRSFRLIMKLCFTFHPDIFNPLRHTSEGWCPGRPMAVPQQVLLDAGLYGMTDGGRAWFYA